jgi:hypothetical protein
MHLKLHVLIHFASTFVEKEFVFRSMGKVPRHTGVISGTEMHRQNSRKAGIEAGM